MKSQPVEDVFNQISQQTGIKFFYDHESISQAPQLTLKLSNASLQETLNAIAKQTNLRFERKGNTVLVSAFKDNSDNENTGKPVFVKGTVSDNNGEPIIGASIQVKGTTTGTITDIDGNFSLSASNGQILVVSYIGYQSAQVKASEKPLTITLAESNVAVDEVVVTALGIRKEKKALAYSVTEVKGDEMNRVKVANLATGLAGKVAGVNVSKPASGVMGSSRIIIRGNGSLNGSNQPLYVIDGIPMDNTNYGQTGMWGGADGGDGISSINSEDIESMSVLKGGTAAALYGSRASNGAIVITTKRGAVGRVKVEYNLSYTNDHIVFKNDDLQWEYGAGANGANAEQMAYGVAMQQIQQNGWPESMLPTLIDNIAPMLASQINMLSFGSKLDGKDVMQFDGVRRPYVASGKNNFKNFYENAWALTNNVAVSGGTEKVQFRVAAGDQRFHDLMPNSKLFRNNLTLNVTSKLDEHLTLKAHVMYVRERSKNRPGLGDLTSNANATLFMLSPNTDVRLLEKRVDDNGMEFLPTGQTYIGNPYFIAYNHSNKDSKDRVIGSIEAQYNFTPNWYVRGKFGGDMINRRSESITPYGTAIDTDGAITNSSIYNGEFNAEAIAGYTNTFRDNLFSVDAFLGWNTMGTWYNQTTANGQGFIQPDFNAMGNSSVTSGSSSRSESYINSLFGQLELSYKSMLYFTFTGRNDWFSALSYKGKNSSNHIFYPSIGAGFIVSEAFQLPEWIPYLKVRGSWAQSGGSVGAYNLGLTYAFNQKIHGQPIGSISPTIIPNLNLKPLTSTSYEIGLDARFLNNRIGIDFTYYVRNTKDDIVDAGVSAASGYQGVRINAGKVHNHGVELLLTAVPVKTKYFTWNTSFNFAYNKSEVKKITDEIDEFILETARTGHDGDNCGPAYIYHEVGEPYGIIKGESYKRNENGEIMYDENGLPMKGGIKKLGESVAPYTLGFNNSFSYKGFNLSFLIDAKIGGDIFSMTNAHMYSFGRHVDTLPGREGGVAGKGVKADGKTPNDVKAEAMKYYMAVAGITEEFVYNASFVKLRELSFGYTFPQKWVKKLGMSSLSLAIVGRNLWNIYDDVPLVDPEAMLNIGNGQGFESYGMPATRSIGFNLNVKF
ncbi:TonB-dependent receptor plug [gut metagenome]|uniref:TonB-dependent receptor plug n=1 Tax=gut metagenome TaxID=749906 RepID=J9FUL3_9ZZZZ